MKLLERTNIPLADRRRIAERHPGVLKIEKPVACDGLVTVWKSRAQRVSHRPTTRADVTYDACSRHAHWSYRLTPNTATSARHIRFHYCWQHLISQGMYGSKLETERTERFVEREYERLANETETQ